MEVETILKKWGNSFGVIIPRTEIKKHNFKVNQKVIVSLDKKETTKVKDLFGMFADLKSDTQNILKTIDKELDIGR
ncbi:TPA: hypothetical protein HA246_03470 [Candidatus Woesearchaeota archaeon]|nr:hypothetical protein [Candidatus Woesearchaeota archaeon]